MTAAGWLALAVFWVLTTLPSVASVRAEGLAAGGRLVAGVSPGWQVRSVAWSGRGLPWRVVIVAGGGGLVVAVLLHGGPALAVAAGAIITTTALLVRDFVRSRADRRLRRDLQTAIGVLVGELDAGAQPASALGAAAGTSVSMTRVLGPATELARRGGEAAALLAASELGAVRAIGLAWRLVDATGAALAGVIERVAADVAAGDEQHRAVQVALAGPRSSALLLAVLPAIGICLGVGMGAHPLDFLLGDPAGRAVCCVGVLLDAAGVLWVRRIVRRAERA